MNYENRIEEINKEVDAIIESVTSKLTRENDMFEFAWKDGVIVIHARPYAIIGIEKKKDWSYPSNYCVITDQAHKIHDIDSVRGQLADIIVKDIKYRVENNHPDITPEMMDLTYGDNWFYERNLIDELTPEGSLLTMMHALNWSEAKKLIILRGLDIEIPDDPKEIIIKYHDVGPRSAISVRIDSV